MQQEILRKLCHDSSLHLEQGKKAIMAELSQMKQRRKCAKGPAAFLTSDHITKRDLRRLCERLLQAGVEQDLGKIPQMSMLDIDLKQNKLLFQLQPVCAFMLRLCTWFGLLSAEEAVGSPRTTYWRDEVERWLPLPT